MQFKQHFELFYMVLSNEVVKLCESKVYDHGSMIFPDCFQVIWNLFLQVFGFGGVISFAIQTFPLWWDFNIVIQKHFSKNILKVVFRFDFTYMQHDLTPLWSIFW